MHLSRTGKEPPLSDVQNRKSAGSLALATVAVFFGLAAMGLPLPALPAQLVNRYAFDMNAVGWMMAAQSVATLLSRPWAGRLVDRHGARYAVTIGLVSMMFSGLAYGTAALDVGGSAAGIGLILTGRILTGLGEGLVITGGGTWAVGLAGPDKAGWAMSWVYELRSHAARRFWRSVAGRPPGPEFRVMPAQLRQWHILSLRALDAHLHGE